MRHDNKFEGPHENGQKNIAHGTRGHAHQRGINTDVKHQGLRTLVSFSVQYCQKLSYTLNSNSRNDLGLNVAHIYLFLMPL